MYLYKRTNIKRSKPPSRKSAVLGKLRNVRFLISFLLTSYRTTINHTPAVYNKEKNLVGKHDFLLDVALGLAYLAVPDYELEACGLKNHSL